MIKKRKFPWFYTILSLLLIIGIICVSYGLSVLKKWMADYEQSQPKYTAQRIFDQYFANPNIGKLIKEGDYTLSPAEDFADLERYVTQQIGSGKIVYNKTNGSVDKKLQKYVVSAGDYKFAQFTVVDSGRRTEYNNPIYELGEYEFFYTTENTSVKIIAPSDASVTVNGYLLDSSYVTSTAETDSCAHMPSKILHNDNPAQGVTYSTYVLSGLLYPTNDIKVIDKYGDECAVTKDENGVFSAKINYNANLKEQYSDLAMQFAKGYAKYAQGCGKFADFDETMDKESSVYLKVKNLANHFVHAHDSCEFTKESTDEFYQYAPDVFSCRVSFTWHAYRENAPEAFEYIDMTLYFRQVEEAFVIYDMLTHTELSN